MVLKDNYERSNAFAKPQHVRVRSLKIVFQTAAALSSISEKKPLGAKPSAATVRPAMAPPGQKPKAFEARTQSSSCSRGLANSLPWISEHTVLWPLSLPAFAAYLLTWATMD